MTDWSRSERTVKTVEYTVPASEPWGACWNQVQQALDAACREYNERYKRDREPSDDAIRAHVTDDAIVFQFTAPEGGEASG